MTEPNVLLVEEFKKRIWASNSEETVIQLRNPITDMLMLDMLDLDEYIEISNEIDRYIAYSLTNKSHTSRKPLNAVDIRLDKLEETNKDLQHQLNKVKSAVIHESLSVKDSKPSK